ncbi:MAG TPA: MarR family transcriptional regulator [Nitrolancea sp.]|nr:MarR family transcriptional regulator [Nitrolancea sp.]
MDLKQFKLQTVYTADCRWAQLEREIESREGDMDSAANSGDSKESETDVGQNPSFGSSLGWQLSTVGRLIRGEAEAALGTFGLRNQHFAVLLILGAGGTAPQGEVARRAFTDKSTMVAIVDHLEQLGLVERRRNPKNRRSQELILTDKGSSVLVQAQHAVAEVEERFLAPLSDQERQRLHLMLGRLLAAQGFA